MKPIVSSAVGLTVAAMALSIPGLAQAAPSPTASPTASPSAGATPSRSASARPTPSPKPSASTPAASPAPTASPTPSPGRPPASPLATPAIAAKYAQNAWLGAAQGGEVSVAGGRYQAYAKGTIFWSQATGAWALRDAILTRYTALGGPTSPLGFPTSDVFRGLTGADVANFSGGTIIGSAKEAHAVYGAIFKAYAAHGYEGGILGKPVTSEFGGANGARVVNFENGQIIWSPETGAQAVYGAIAKEYAALGYEGGVLGKPITSEFEGSTGARVVNFENGQIIWSPETGAHAVYGAIAKEYAALGHEGGILGKPTSTEFAGANGARVVRFERGLIIWTPKTGAHAVFGAILREFEAKGFEGGPLGAPVSNEFKPGTGAIVQHFQNGIVIFTPASGAHAVHGAILTTYGVHGFEGGPLGVPVTSEFVGRNGAIVQNFANGQIIFTPATGAHAVQGAIAEEYAALGHEAGPLGAPTSSEFAGRNGARVNRFQNGLMIWTGRTGAFAVRGALLSGYAANGYEGGTLGAPTTNEFPIAGGFAQDFERGRLEFVNGRINVVRPGPDVDARCRTGRVMCISKSDRKLRWMIDGRVVKEMDARFGAAGTPTREGEFRVFSKVRDEISYLYGNTPMPFAMYFSGGEAVHYSYDFARYGYGKTAFASHGCVNIRDYNGIQWLYDTQVKIGDKVVVYW